jgi:hypothetical protein
MKLVRMLCNNPGHVSISQRRVIHSLPSGRFGGQYYDRVDSVYNVLIYGSFGRVHHFLAALRRRRAPPFRLTGAVFPGLMFLGSRS